MFLLVECTNASITAVTSCLVLLHQDTNWVMYLLFNSHKSYRINQHQNHQLRMRLHLQLELMTSIHSHQRLNHDSGGWARGLASTVRPTAGFNGGSSVDTVRQERQLWCLLQTHVSWGCPRRSVGSRTETQLHWQAYARTPLLRLSLAPSFCRSGVLFLMFRANGDQIIITMFTVVKTAKSCL